MATLALAGGTSTSLGRAIVTAVISAQQSPPWKTVILSRNTDVPPWLRAIDEEGAHTQIRPVDYFSPESLSAALTNVHTVISVTSAIDGTQAEIQINLLHAAIKAGCKRFAPSQWGFGPKGWQNVSSLQWTLGDVWDECVNHKNEIECARFNQGSFMNYIGHGIYATPLTSEPPAEMVIAQLKLGHGYAPGEDEACQGLQRQGDLEDGSGAFLIGLANGVAELPMKEDGEWPRISMTSVTDVGRFVAASLNLPTWEENMTMVGDTLTMGELLAHAEAVTGKKFRDDYMGRMWAEFKLAYIRDLTDEVVLEPVVNRLCPAVKPMTAREYMERFWPGA